LQNISRFFTTGPVTHSSDIADVGAEKDELQEETEGRLKNFCEYLTGSADFHLFVPVPMNIAIANGAIDEPTQVSTFELPGRALLLSFRGTFFYRPASFFAVVAVFT
jgi:hypothetical protein